MEKIFRKQLITGIIGMLATAGVFVFLGVNGILEGNRWVMYLVVWAMFSSFIGFLCYCFGGKELFVFGAKYGTGFVGFVVAGKELPTWLFGILVFLGISIFLGHRFIKEYRKDKGQVVDVEEQLEAEIEEELDEMKQGIGFGERCLFLLTSMGTFYQLIKGRDKFYLIRVGTELSGLDWETVKRNEADVNVGKKDYTIVCSEITEISCHYGKAYGTPTENCGRLSISAGGKKRHFIIVDNPSPTAVEGFFAGLPFTMKVKKRKEMPERSLTEAEQEILPTLKRVFLLLMIVSVVCSAMLFFLFIDMTVYIVLAMLCILIPAVVFILYVRFNGILFLSDERKGFGKTGINISVPLLLPSLVLGLEALRNFTILDVWTWAFWSVALMLVVFVVFFKMTREYKTYKSIVVYIILAAILHLPSSVIFVNCLFDPSDPVVYSSTIIGKSISENDTGTSYHFEVTLQNGRRQEFVVLNDVYEAYEEGSSVEVLEKPGLLGIGFGFINE